MTLAARLDGVEIKVTIDASATDRAMELLDLDPNEAKRRRIWFCEVPARPGTSSGPVLLGHRVILRLRETEGEDADSTVKLRPLVPPDLRPAWRQVFGLDDGELRVEGDWVGERKVVSAALQWEQDEDEPRQAAAGRRPLTKLFSRKQQDFLRDHAPVPVDLTALRVFGPIAALKWSPSDRGLPSHLAAEHWKVDDLEFLELSLRASNPAEAEHLQQELDALAEDRGLARTLAQETKTRTVLEHLLRRP